MSRIPSEKHYSHRERLLDRWVDLANILPAQERIPEPPVIVAIPVPVSMKAAARTRQRAKNRKEKKRSQPGWATVPATTPGLDDAIEKARKAWEERLNTLPRLGGSAVDRYETFYRVRETLRDIVKEISAPAFSRPTRPYTTWFGAGIRTFATRPRKIQLVGRGIFLSEDPYGIFLNVLEQAGEEIYSLKFCPVCDAIFQPRRKDQRTCAPRCANVLRVRNQRKYERTRQRAKDRKQKKRRTGR